MEFYDVKNTSTSLFWIDSKNADGRKNVDTGALQSKDTNFLNFETKLPMANTAAISISRVRLDARLPRLQPSEQTAFVIQGPALGGPFQILTLIWPTRGHHNFSGVSDVQSSPGIKGNFIEFIQAHNTNAAPYDVVLNQVGTDGHLSFTTKHGNSYIGMIDCPFWRKLGFSDFKNTTTVNGVQVQHSTVVNHNTFIYSDKPHDYRVPDLYLHIDLEVNSEQHQRHQNIIYRTLFDDKTMFDYTNALSQQPPTALEIPSYLDKERVTTPIELMNKGLPINRFRLSWHYENGQKANLDGAEWSCKLEFIHLAPYKTIAY